jgi:predicted  nucleic acid-binding Zn-ribbon protein
MAWSTATATIFEKIGTWLTTTAVGKAISWTVAIVTVGTGVKGFQEARELMSRGQDILGQKTSQGGKLPIIYGRRRVGSTVVFMNTADKRSKDLFVVYALSVGEVDQIELDTIEINGVSIKDTAVFRQGYYAGSDKISSGAGSLCTASQIGTVQQSNAGTSGTDPTKRYRMVFNAHHGADNQSADPMLTASISSQWTSNHRLRGVAYLACSFEYDNRGMFSSIPQLTVIVRGKKLYDPRLDSSISGGSGSHRIDDPDTYEWSDNAVLCTLDYMTNDEYGKGLGASSLNLQSFQTAADTSDELEDTPDYSGSYAAATFSTISGQREITVDETTWIQAKASGKLNLRDSGSSSVFADCEVVNGYRFEPFDGDIQHRLVLDCSAPSTYTDENGTALVQVKRFHCNGLVDANKNVLENTRELLANMRGILNYIDGKYEIVLEDTASSSFTVTDDHIINSAGVTLNYESKADKANKVVVQFFNEKKKFEMDTVTVFHDATPNYKSDDGGEELELVVDFPYVINSYVAYNMGQAILGRSRNQQTISFTAVPELYKVKVGDVITVAYTPLGLTGKLFRVENIGLEPTGLVNIQAIEYLDIYTWEAPPQEVIEDYTYIPQGFEVSAPTGLTFTDSNTSATGRPFLSWNEPTDFAFHEYRINIVDSSSNKLMNRIVDVNFVDLTFLPVGSNYVASVSSINSVGSESDAATLTFSVSVAPVSTADVKDDAITLDKIGSDVQSAINAGGTNSTQLIKSTSAPTQRNDGSSLQAQDLWADTDDNNQVYVRNAANNGWEKARDSSLITLYNSLSSTVSTNSSNISTAQSDIVTLTTDTSANSTAITNLQSSLATTNSNVSANASNITSLQTQVTANDGDISSLSSSVTSLQSSLATTNSNVSANASNITSLQTQVTSNDGDISSLSSSLTSLTSTVNSNTAAISSEATTRANADSALSTSITNLTSTVNGNTSSISTNASAIADIEGNAAASYVLQLNANGKVAQMVLESNASSGTGATSTIAFLADTFKIDNNAGSSVSPFVVTGGTVYIDNARITDLSADKIRIDNVTLDTDGSGNLIIKTEGVNTTQIADRATSVFATATGGIGYWTIDNLAQTAIVTTGVFQAPSATGNTFFIIGNTYINANSGSSTADWCELQIQRRSASTSGGVSSAAYSTIATIRARGETGEALQSIIANDAYTADYYYQYRVTLQTNGTGVLYSTRSYGISGIQVIVNYK